MLRITNQSLTNTARLFIQTPGAVLMNKTYTTT
jgi:hypothetical protein